MDNIAELTPVSREDQLFYDLREMIIGLNGIASVQLEDRQDPTAATLQSYVRNYTERAMKICLELQDSFHRRTGL